jgi:hypothetical protein
VKHGFHQLLEREPGSRRRRRLSSSRHGKSMPTWRRRRHSKLEHRAGLLDTAAAIR